MCVDDLFQFYTEWTDFSPYNCYITSAIQYILDVFQIKWDIIRYLIVVTW